MKNNKLVGLALVLGIGGYMFGRSQSSTKENYYSVPGVGDVPESELPSHGYVKYNGQWFLQSDLIAAAQTNGITPDPNGGATIPDPSTQVGWDIFNTLLSAGAGITATIINNNAAKKADLIQQIKTKYTVLVSTSYDPNFPYTDTQLEGFTIPKLEKILDGDFTIAGYRGRRSNHWAHNL